jgi:hypothetical protein
MAMKVLTTFESALIVGALQLGFHLEAEPMPVAHGGCLLDVLGAYVHRLRLEDILQVNYPLEFQEDGLDRSLLLRLCLQAGGWLLIHLDAGGESW